MNLSERGLDLIKGFEGYHTKLPNGDCIAYRCPANVLTIGYGCTKGVREGMIWTEAQAKAALAKEIATHESAVMRLVSVDLNQNQFDALVSFAYNVGNGALEKSTLLKKLNAGDYPGAQAEFMKWNKGGGKVLRGLSIRRAKEAALFAERVEEDEPTPLPQAIEAPKEPISNTTKAVAAAAGGGAVAKGGEAMIAAPPANVTDTVANVDMWSKVGKAAQTMADGLWKSPIFAATLFAVAIACIWGPTLYKKVTS
jgi:GH24 family phage-related lysozyme (muramidase)